jgi:DNA polymerase III epsilon subunit-like protein
VSSDGTRGFDGKHLAREFLEAGLNPPSPYKDIDLMLAVKRQFRFPSNKLQYVATRLGLGGKVQHSGHELWVRCLAGDDAAWEEMRAYQVQDVDLLIPLLERLKPWIPNYPHMACMTASNPVAHVAGRTRCSVAGQRRPRPARTPGSNANRALDGREARNASPLRN